MKGHKTLTRKTLLDLEGYVYRNVIINHTSERYGSRYIEAVHKYDVKANQFDSYFIIVVNGEQVFKTYSFSHAFTELRKIKIKKKT